MYKHWDRETKVGALFKNVQDLIPFRRFRLKVKWMNLIVSSLGLVHMARLVCMRFHKRVRRCLVLRPTQDPRTNTARHTAEAAS